MEAIREKSLPANEAQSFEALCGEVEQALTHARTAPVLVAGAGVTGRATAALFCSAGFKVIVVDEKPLNPDARDRLAPALVVDDAASLPERLDALPSVLAFVLISPGINPNSEFGRALYALNAPLFTELDLAFPFLGMPRAGVTGTNGKTTVVSLIHEMLAASNLPAELVGNIGLPFLSKLTPQQITSGRAAFGSGGNKHWIAEFSSYQLETVRFIDPEVGVLLNVDDDHLERHGALENVLRAKARLFKWQNKRTDYSILNADQSWSERLGNECGGQPLMFGLRNSENAGRSGCFFDAEKNELGLTANGIDESYSLERCSLLGVHNKLNLAAAVLCARLLGADKSRVQHIIENFKPLAHRVEFVREMRGVRFFNDSKGTNISSVVVALDTLHSEFAKSKVILLVGGKMKKGDWEPLRKKIPLNVRSVIGFGADGPSVIGELKLSPDFEVRSTKTLADAVRTAHSLSASGDLILLSPGCASFDEFKDFADRGEHFKSVVQQLQ